MSVGAAGRDIELTDFAIYSRREALSEDEEKHEDPDVSARGSSGSLVPVRAAPSSFANPPSISFLSFVPKRDLGRITPLVSRDWREMSQREIETRCLALSNTSYRIGPGVSLDRLAFQKQAFDLLDAQSELGNKIRTFYQKARIPGNNALIVFYPNGAECLRIMISSNKAPAHGVLLPRTLFHANPGDSGIEKYVLTEFPFQDEENASIANKHPHSFMICHERTANYLAPRVRLKCPFHVQVQMRFPAQFSDSDRAIMQQLVGEFSDHKALKNEHILRELEDKVFAKLKPSTAVFWRQCFTKWLNNEHISPEIAVDKAHELLKVMADIEANVRVADILIKSPALLDFLENPTVQDSAAKALLWMMSLPGNVNCFLPALKRFEKEILSSKDRGAKKLLGKIFDLYTKSVVRLPSSESRTADLSQLALRATDASHPSRLLSGILDIILRAEEGQILLNWPDPLDDPFDY